MIEEVKKILMKPRVRCGVTADQTERRYMIATEFVEEIAHQIDALHRQKMRELFEYVENNVSWLEDEAAQCEGGLSSCPFWKAIKEKHLEKGD